MLSDNSIVEIKLVHGKLVVACVPEPEITLEQLLDDVNERNLSRREVSVSPDAELEEG